MTSAVFYNDWNTADIYMDGPRAAILKDKTYLCDEVLYVWSAGEGTLVKSSGGGSGSGFYNVTLLHPLGSGYYTKETAVAALVNADIDDADKPGTIITFEVSAGRWEDYRFGGTGTENWLEPSAWERFGEVTPSRSQGNERDFLGRACSGRTGGGCSGYTCS
jgi:hypothetical protein